MKIKLYPMIKQSIASMMLLLLMLLGVVNALAQTPPVCTTAIAGINMCTNPPVKKSSCSSCTGEVAITFNALEFSSDYVKSNLKFQLHQVVNGVLKKTDPNNSEFTGSIRKFVNVCPGEFKIVIEYVEAKFKGMACATKEISGVMLAEGEGNFAVNLVSTTNETIVINTTAKSPKYSWSSSTYGNSTPALPGNQYTVTVTDELGCTKVGGPYKLPDDCGVNNNFDFELQVNGPRVYRGAGEFFSAKVKPNGSSSFINPDPNQYTVKWEYNSGTGSTVLGTGATFPADKSNFQGRDYIFVEVANKCKSKTLLYTLSPCGTINPENYLTAQVLQQPCESADETIDQTGAISLVLPGVASSIANQLTFTANGVGVSAAVTNNNPLTMKLSGLKHGNQRIAVIVDQCPYYKDISIEPQEANYTFTDYNRNTGLCTFKKVCKGQATMTLSIAPVRTYSSAIDANQRAKNKKKFCQPKADCVLGNASRIGLNNGEWEDAVSTWNGVFQAVIDAALNDPNSQLTEEERNRLKDECYRGRERRECREIVFCPGTFTVIDEQYPLFGRKYSGEQITEKGGKMCLEVSCGNPTVVKSTCDPAIANVIDISEPKPRENRNCDDEGDNPPTGGGCNSKTRETQTIAWLMDEFDNFHKVDANGLPAPEGFFAGKTDFKPKDALLYDFLAKIKALSLPREAVGCKKITFCSVSPYFVEDEQNISSEIKDAVYCLTCQSGLTTYTLGNLFVATDPKAMAAKAKISDVMAQIGGNQRYACLVVTYCASSDKIYREDVLRSDIQKIKNNTKSPCPTACNGTDWISNPFALIVKQYNDAFKVGGETKVKEVFGAQFYDNSDLLELIRDFGSRHTNAGNSNCTKVSYCKNTLMVYDIFRVKDELGFQKCGNGFHEHGQEEMSFASSNLIEEDPYIEDIPKDVKYFVDSTHAEKFIAFAPISNEGRISPKATMIAEDGGYYYNYSHDNIDIENITDSLLVYRHDDWDNYVTWYLEQNQANREFVLTCTSDSVGFAAPLESDSLLRFTHFTVRDSFLYLSGYYTGALRYRAELVDDQPTHAHINGFVLRINQQGTLRGSAIFENIDTTLNGFRVELGKKGDVLVAGKVKSEALVVNQTPQATGLTGGGFLGSLNAQTHAFSLISKVDLSAGANILRAAVEPNQLAYALVLGNVSSVAAQSGSIQVSSGNKMAVLALNAQGALSWARYFNGNIDPTQLDITYGYAQQLNVGITYSGAVSVDATQYFNSVGKQDIGLIQFDQQGQYRWHRSYGSPETETVVELLYDAGILYFGGNFAGAQGFRSIGGYDFYNPTPFHERAYVSYYADSIAVDSALANTPELAALSAPVLQKSSTPDRTFKVFPNPFKDEIMTEFEAQTSENMSIEVLNELGRVVKTQRFGAIPGFNRQQISTQQFPAGIYFIYLRNQAGQVLKVQKLVKM